MNHFSLEQAWDISGMSCLLEVSAHYKSDYLSLLAKGV